MTIEEAELARCIAALRRVGTVVKDNQQRIAVKGAQYMAAQIRPSAPRSTRAHKRYSTGKLVRRLRAPKGFGRVVATYDPGNLARSIKALKFTRSKTKAWVGAKLAKGQSSYGNFSGARTDGYYLHMVDGGTQNYAGTRFFTRAAESATPGTYRVMIHEWQKLIAQQNNNIP